MKPQTSTTTTRGQQSQVKEPVLSRKPTPDHQMQKGSMAKDVGSIASSSGIKSKNKPSKKRRDALKKKLVEFQGIRNVTEPMEVMSGDAKIYQGLVNCEKFILV